MALNVEDKQNFSNGLAIDCPVLSDVEPLSSNINLYDSQTSRKRKLRTTTVDKISYNNKFTRRVFEGNRIEYTWERDGNTIPLDENDGFKHELLEGWIVELRTRQDGCTKERYFSHPTVKTQFRSIKQVQKYLATKVDGPNEKTTEEQTGAMIEEQIEVKIEEQREAKIEEQEEANQRDLELFLTECLADFPDYFGGQN